MIPIEVLRRVKQIFVHANCPDGMASAMILKDAYRMLGMSPKIEFVGYNTEVYKNAGFDVCGDPSCELSLFCDIAPHKESAAALRGHAIVLDHHKGNNGETERLVKSFGDLAVFADEILEPGVSGATLAFREVWKPIALEHERLRNLDGHGDLTPLPAVRDFAECCGLRDTWQTKDRRFMRGQWMSKMLMSKPPSYWLEERDVGPFDMGHPPYLSEEQIAIGKALFEAHEEAVQQAANNCVFYYAGNVTHDHVDIFAGILIFQDTGAGFRLTSDVAEVMRQRWEKLDVADSLDLANTLGMKELKALLENNCPVILAGFYYTKVEGKAQLTYSLRPVRGDFNVAELAAFCGGGGHSKAAAFEVREPGDSFISSTNVVQMPFEYIRRRFDDFLRHKKPGGS